MATKEKTKKPKELTLESLQKDQQKIADMIGKLEPNMSDEDREAQVEKIQKATKKLEAKAQVLEQKALAKYPPSPPKKPYWVKIELTPAQRERIYERTGVDLIAIRQEDPSGRFAKDMPPTPPDNVEALAFKHAMSLKNYYDTMDKADKELPPDQKDVLEMIKKDPKHKEKVFRNVKLGDRKYQRRDKDKPEKKDDKKKGKKGKKGGKKGSKKSE